MKQLSIILYGLFLGCFALFSYLFVDPGLSYLHFFYSNFFQTHRTATASIFIFFVVIFTYFYGLFLWFAHRKQLTKRQLFILIVLSIVLLLPSYPAFISFDIFNYIATAKVVFFYHENPYLIMPIAFTHDPLLLFMHAANKTALYAPFWILLTGIPFVLGFGNFLTTLLNFKIFIALFYFATVFLIWKITKDISKTAFFCLNPLVIIESLMSSHNDIVMIFLLLASIYFIIKKQKLSGLVFFLLSIGIKYATAILLPVYWYVLKNKTPDWQKIFTIITLFMLVIFLLSNFREEIYPWYGIWFLLPSTFIIGNNLITWITITFSISLLLRYIPFMLLGTYFGSTPFLKTAFTFGPVVLAIILYFITQKPKRFV